MRTVTRKGTKLTPNKYLYGIEDVVEVPQQVINEKVKLLNENLTYLLDVPLAFRDTSRINAVVKAIKFWKDINTKG